MDVLNRHNRVKSFSLKPVLSLLLTISAFGLILSGCHTNAEGGASQTALLSSMAREDSLGGAFATNAETLAATQVSSLQNAPMPSFREAAIVPAMAYASSQPEPSKRSMATNLAFETPANAPAGLDELIQKYASVYQVPERLVRRVVHRESRFNPAARNGPYWGLMQISHQTARGMGYRGTASGLLDAETNLKYAVKYLSGAYKVAEGDESQAVKFYARGYYYDAKRKGLLEETGLRPARK